MALGVGQVLGWPAWLGVAHRRSGTTQIVEDADCVGTSCWYNHTWRAYTTGVRPVLRPATYGSTSTDQHGADVCGSNSGRVVGVVLACGALFVCTKCARPLITSVSLTTGSTCCLPPSTSRSLSRIRCSDRRTVQHRVVRVARHRVRLALLVHGLPGALLLITLEYEVHTAEDVWPSD